MVRMSAEQRFKAVVQALIMEGTHPTPTAIKRRLVSVETYFFGRLNNLNGRECRWLRVDMKVPAIKKGYPYSGTCEHACCRA